MNRIPWVVGLTVSVCLGCGQTETASVVRGQQADYFTKKRECYELASQRQTREQNARGKPPGLNDHLVYLDSEQCYVPSINTCIYESGFIVVRDGKASMTVSDLLTGHDLTSGNSDDPKYKQERDRLFALCAK